MTNDEIDFSMRQAKVLKMKEHRKKKICEALQQVDQAPTRGELVLPSAGEDLSEEEEGSLDCLDLASCEGQDEKWENGDLEKVLIDMNEISLSIISLLKRVGISLAFGDESGTYRKVVSESSLYEINSKHKQ